MEEQLEKIKEKALGQIESSEVLEKLNDTRVSYLGKKGELTSPLKNMKDVVPEDRPRVDQAVNDVRGLIEGRLERARIALAKKVRGEQLKREVINVTLSAKKNNVSHSHPNAIALEEVEHVLMGMGHEVVEGPEMEYDRYNFEKLNIPRGHPVRDEQDIFYINENIPLYDQTSPVQVRTVKQGKLPIHMIVPGHVFRSDEMGVAHSPSLYQIKGLVIDKNITFADLKGILAEFTRELFGSETKVKSRPHHSPFTEPSIEVDVICFKCGGSGYRLCKGSGRMEILRRGMVHPRALKVRGTDPDVYSGFVFGVGLERIALFKYEVDSMCLLYENDIRLLK